jgi:hypothetical protein
MEVLAGYGSGSEDSSEAAGDDQDASSAPAAPLFKPAWQEEALDADDSDEDAAVQAAADEAKRIEGCALPASAVSPGCAGPVS